VLVSHHHCDKITDNHLIRRKGLLRVTVLQVSVSPWSLGLVAFGPVVWQNIMVRAQGRIAAHLMTARKQRETGRACGPNIPFKDIPSMI
jgi:hypothetical protein